MCVVIKITTFDFYFFHDFEIWSLSARSKANFKWSLRVFSISCVGQFKLFSAKCDRYNWRRKPHANCAPGLLSPYLCIRLNRRRAQADPCGHHITKNQPTRPIHESRYTWTPPPMNTLQFAISPACSTFSIQQDENQTRTACAKRFIFIFEAGRKSCARKSLPTHIYLYYIQKRDLLLLIWKKCTTCSVCSSVDVCRNSFASTRRSL